MGACMTWNYRIVRYRDGSGFGLHRVHYDANNFPWMMTESPAVFVGDSVDELQKSLLLAYNDANARPVFDEPEVWLGKGP